MREYGDKVAAIIVEPVIGNAGVILPRDGFLKELRRIADEHGALLILDEVITGFRLSLGGAQQYYGVKADITTLGKIIGGGFPLAAIVGRREIMENLTPTGKVFNAGTYNSHPVSVAAGLATIEVLETTDAYAVANSAAEKIAKTLEELASRYGFDATVNHVASMFQIFFVKGEVWSYEDAQKSDKRLYTKLHEKLLGKNVFVTPSQMEAWFTSAVHSTDVVEQTIAALEEVFKELKREA